MNHNGGVKSGIVLAPGVIETVTMVDEGGGALWKVELWRQLTRLINLW